MTNLKHFYKVNSEEISDTIFILLLGSVISLVCVVFLIAAIKNHDTTSIVGMSALLLTWGGSLFFIAGEQIYEMVKNYKEDKAKQVR